ncbi:MAG: LysM peptidoglycan-binding domain-containing protein [Anaerolineales bacterium]
MLKNRRIWMIILLAGLLAACGSAGNQAAETPGTPTATQPGPAITPYITNTPSGMDGPTATPAPTATLPPLPTPTPFMHTIVENDTLIGIATFYGVTTEAIMTANPGIDPNFLSIGDQLIIPLPVAEVDGEDVTAQPQTLPLETGPVNCYRLRTEGWWCFFEVTNTLEQPAENITALVRLFGAQGEDVAGQTVAALVNVLRPGEHLALAAYFPPPVGDWTEAQGQLLSAAQANQVDTRYLPVTLGEMQTLPLTEDGLGMTVSGSVQLPADASVEYVWVLATAYDADGAVVGVRRWEANPEQIAGGEGSFSLEIYSMGKPIERVDMLAESRAVP